MSARHAVDELLERVRAARAEKAAAVAVAVDVHDRVLAAAPSACCLGPFGGSEQPRLLAVPGGVDDRPLRPPALLQQLAERARLFELGAMPLTGSLRAVHPGVVMVAANDPLVGIRRARESAR